MQQRPSKNERYEKVFYDFKLRPHRNDGGSSTVGQADSRQRISCILNAWEFPAL